MTMNKEKIKGWLLADINRYGLSDIDSFIESRRNIDFRDVELEADLRECIKELEEEGWIKHENVRSEKIYMHVPNSAKKEK